ncbi:hypothetical protein G7070_11800 [Propioniciclava coleopterorum]|uniref:Pullulanase N2 domain-containing protein n=1 Tax=Propioniciclava coleopterorum TaxID=2714937 RepID=A0A6G7Y872_9ACTN|nr:hypothetical protein [Propioniciclava coleopterorum]QIK72831.1 hypothetical protein G7070_11800 [Propioniciclava coleopterorum]
MDAARERGRRHRPGAPRAGALDPDPADARARPPPPDAVAEHPHLAGAAALVLPADVDAAALAAGQLALLGRDPRGAVVAATGVQTAPLLDALYPDPDAPGVSWEDGVPTLRLWAPTARAVDILVWPAGPPAEHDSGAPAAPRSGEVSGDPLRVPASRHPDGTWSVVGSPGWADARYLYAVTVYAPAFDRVVKNRVTDPYALALTADSAAAVLVDPSDARWADPRWLAAPSPPLVHPVDQVSYELHVRDFSRDDVTVPADLRGTYAAFGVEGRGRAHLRRLAQAGLTSVQLLPVHDFASVPERRDAWVQPDPAALRAAPPDSAEQQRLAAHRPGSPFNWGYDPWHFLAPEGSYATSAALDGGRRIAELRGAVGALHELGLRVVLDVVFNHTRDAGQQPASVLDKIVPGYYHRRALDGRVATSTAGPSVATERRMAARLVTDAAVHWARHYRIDGFRFDLMGHHGRDVMLGVRAALDALTPSATESTAAASRCTARAGTSGRWPATPASCRPPRASSTAPASPPFPTGCATPSAAGRRSTPTRAGRAGRPGWPARPTAPRSTAAPTSRHNGCWPRPTSSRSGWPAPCATSRSARRALAG